MNPTRDLLLTMSTYRSERRAQIVASIQSAPSELVHRAGTIAGGVGNGSIYAAFAHVVDVEHMWLHQHLLAESAPATSGSADRRDLTELAETWALTSGTWETFILAHSDEELQRHHHFVDGTSVPTWLVVIHAYNHTTHHVSELWTAFTAAGVQPPELSLMQWARQHDWSE